MNDWINSLVCTQAPFETTCLSAFCPMCQYGHNVQKFKQSNEEIAPSWIPHTCGYFGSYAVGSILFILYANAFATLSHATLNPELINTIGNLGGSICLGAYAGKFRSELREKYNIKGSKFNDCLIHSLISPCALCQEAQEIEIRSKGNESLVIGSFEAPYIPVMSKD